MPSVSTKGGVFTIRYEALGPDGKPALFENCYKPDGESVFERRCETRTRMEIFDERREHLRQELPYVRCAGIFRPTEFSNLLAFLDKQELEENVFLNWRVTGSNHYNRIAVGAPSFYANEPFPPRPCVSEILFREGVLALAWVRSTGSSYEIVFTQIRISDSLRSDTSLGPSFPQVVPLSASNIERDVIIVGDRGAPETNDAPMILRFARFNIPI